MLLEMAALFVFIGFFLLVAGVIIVRHYTLRAKLITAILAIVLSSLTILAVLDGYMMLKALEESTEKAVLGAAKSYATRIDQFNQKNSLLIEEDSNHPTIISFVSKDSNSALDSKSMLEILQALKSRQKEILSYAILNKRGKNILDTSSTLVGIDESNQPCFSLLEKGKQNHYRSPVIFEKHGPVIIFSNTIKDLDNQFIGVLRVKYKASVLTDLFERTTDMVGYGSFVILLDDNNLRLVHGRRFDLTYTLAEQKDKQTIDNLIDSKRLPADTENPSVESIHETEQWFKKVKQVNNHSPVIKTQFYGLGTTLYSSAVVMLETVPWKVIVSLPEDVLIQSIITQTKNALMLIVVIVLAVILIVMVSTHFLLRPVKHLTSVVRSIGQGNLGAKANIETKDEIGELAQAFNEMSESIGELIDDLESEVGSHKLTAESLHQLSQAINQSPVSVMITDLKGKIEYVNPQLCSVSGYSENEIIGENARLFKSDTTPDLLYKYIWNTITSGQSWSGELYNKKKNGDMYWEHVTISPIKNKKNVITHYLAIKEDISVRKDFEERLLYQASYDKLTDLPNRTLAYDRIQQAIVSASGEDKNLALLFLDFDHFKNINDISGHSAGDEFLKLMALRLKECVRRYDTVARLGGDEFLILLLDVDVKDSPVNEGKERRDLKHVNFESFVKWKAQEIIDVVSHPCRIQGQEFSITASIGVALFPQDGDDPHVLLRNADTAMYRSKRKGRNTFELFTPEMGDVVMKRVEIDNKLRHALENGDFYLKYQALMDSREKSIIGAEVLLRWNDKLLGEVTPDDFIPLAEESGLIVEISHWVLETALSTIKQWRKIKGNENLFIAVNLSSRQFRSKEVVTEIADLLKKHELPGSCLELEITERLLMKDVLEIINLLNQFKALGVRLSIDDFGTGYSSLSYLKRFPFDVLKIDKAFIADIKEETDIDSVSQTELDAIALCEAIISMAHTLGLTVIGEGVENKAQFDFLSLRGVETIQGYYVSKPMLDTEFIQFIESSN